MRRKSIKIMKSRVLIIVMVLSVFFSFTSSAMEGVNFGEAVSINETAKEIEEREDNLNKNTETLFSEEKSENSELSINVDEEDGNTSESGEPSANAETIKGQNTVVFEGGSIVGDKDSQSKAVGELQVTSNDNDLSNVILSNSGNTVPIYDANDLAAFLEGGMGNNDDEYILMNDIDMSGLGPFRGRGGDVAFTGRFASEEGSRFTISNLSLKGRDVVAESFGGNDIGFIRTAGDGAIIENIIFDEANYAEPSNLGYLWRESQSHMGLVVGRVDNGTVSIHNIEVKNSSMTIGSATIQQGNVRVGSLIGSVGSAANVDIADKSIDATIQMFNGIAWDNQCGGLVGESAGNLSITDSQVNVDITRNEPWGNFVGVGGVLGRRTAGDVKIEELVQNGNIEADMQAGGIVGSSQGDGSLTLNEVFTSQGKTFLANPTDPYGNCRVGGLVGSAMNRTIITNSENHSEPSLSLNGAFDSEVGGLVGFGSGQTTITDSSNFGNLNQSGAINNTRMAGIVARTENNVTLANVENQGNITRTINPEVGDGFVHPNGHNNRLSSGILGSAVVASGEEVRIDNAVNHGNMPSRIKLLAGIAGRLVGEGDVYITNSTNYGDLETHERAGGIVGRNELLNLEIDSCINYGKINAENGHLTQNMIGGIISTSQTGDGGEGALRPRNVTIRNSANRGEVVSRATGEVWNGTGGIAGWIPNEGLKIENTYNIGPVRSTAASTTVGGIIGTMRFSNVNIVLRNVYSIGPVTTAGSNPANGNGILGYHRPEYEQGVGTGALRLDNVYVSAYFTGNAISDMPDLVRSTNTYVDTSTAPTTDINRLQTELPGVAAVTTDQLVSGSLPGLTGGPWMQGIAGEPFQRTLPYFAWQTRGEQQETFFREILCTNVENITEGIKMWLSGITAFPLINTVDMDVSYSAKGFDFEKVRVFTPNNGGAPYSYLGDEIEVRSISSSLANIPSRSLTTGLISKNDVVGFDLRSGHRISFDLNGGEQIDDTPLFQIIEHGKLAEVPEAEREGYLFTGWNTEPDGKGTTYLPEEEIVIESDDTFYAQWVADTTTLTVAKEVTGEMANLKQEFIFTIYFQGSDGKPLPKDTELSYEGDTVGSYNNQAPNPGKLYLDENGSETFKLAAGQAIRLVDVPAIGSVRIVETPDPIYMTSIIDSEDNVSINGNDTTMLPMARDRAFTFTNERNYIPSTEVEMGNTEPILIGILALSVAEFVLYIVYKHYRRA